MKRKRKRGIKPTGKVTTEFFSYDSAIIIAMATVLGYLVAYRFQMGQFSYYGIDDALFGQIYLNHIIIAVTAVTGFLIAVYIVQVALQWFYKQLSPFWEAVARNLIPSIIIYIATGIIFEFELFYYFVFLLILYRFIMPFFSRDTISYQETLLRQIKKEGTFKELFQALIPESIQKRQLEKRLLYVLLIFILLPQLASFIGNQSIHWKNDYLVFYQEDELHIVLTSTDSTLIAAPYNEEENTYQPSYLVVSFNNYQDSPYTFIPHQVPFALEQAP
ncbi:signal transduction histidine kinase [Alkalihalobacillus xiaoxiensis]|uniref:Signal transduction histidine kinase n=1 Tax=Shouchella xiaoxiensis TaxID=766895 RepID=A0ABS2T0N1_9BACI|nr:hypothetical protein [Shouchella xiaoxiensis]MBM7840570.1 signal transduction histidine kinase [Shouchella xiaoxiensis]